MVKSMVKWKKDFIWGSFFSLVSIAIFLYSNTIEERQFTPPLAESGFYLKVWAVILFVLAVVLMVRSFLARDMSRSERLMSFRVAFTFALIMAYFILFPRLGFCVSTIFFLGGTMMFFHYLGIKNQGKGIWSVRRISQYLIITLLLTGSLYLIFSKVLHVMLP